jgi:acyl-CoA carboxylase epsilon subunit
MTDKPPGPVRPAGPASPVDPVRLAIGAVPAQATPVLTVTAGQPTPEETAAVVVVLAALAGRGGPPAAPAPPPSRWSAPAELVRAPLVPGPGAWRASALPR